MIKSSQFVQCKRWASILYVQFPPYRIRSRDTEYLLAIQDTFVIPYIFQWYRIPFRDTLNLLVIQNTFPRYRKLTPDTENLPVIQKTFPWYRKPSRDTKNLPGIQKTFSCYRKPSRDTENLPVNLRATKKTAGVSWISVWSEFLNFSSWICANFNSFFLYCHLLFIYQVSILFSWCERVSDNNREDLGIEEQLSSKHRGEKFCRGSI